MEVEATDMYKLGNLTVNVTYWRDNGVMVSDTSHLTLSHMFSSELVWETVD